MLRAFMTLSALAVVAVGVSATSFAPPETYPLAVGSAFFCSADFDGDGDIDMAVRHCDDGLFPDQDPNAGISVLFNNGDGTFAEAVEYVTGDMIVCICAIDIDGDGDIDLASTEHVYTEEFSLDSLSIWENDGSGVFELIATQEVPVQYSYDIGCGDYSGDTYSDLALPGYGNDTVCIMQNNGAGVFTVDTVFLTGTEPIQVCPGDLDGDGAVDLAVAYDCDENFGLRIFKNDGAGQLSLNGEYGGWWDMYSGIAASDTDLDGDSDLVLVSLNDRVDTYENNGDGTFGSPDTYYGFFVTNSIAVADFDADGYDDIAITIHPHDSVVIYTNNGDGTFGFESQHWVRAPALLSAQDFDGDGDMDLAAVDASNDSVSILLNTTSETGVADETEPNELPAKFHLGQNHPNPFNPSTTIEFSLPNGSQVSIEIFNTAGQKVRLLLNEERVAGTHVVTWDGCDDAGNRVATGMYLYRLTTDEFTESKKMVLLK